MKKIESIAFDCSLTTSYDEWRELMDDYFAYEAGLINEHDSEARKGPEFDEVCEKFARSQKVYMTGPTGIFHDNLYMARSVALSTAEHLLSMSNVGPLYHVFKEYVIDVDAGKTVEQYYVNPQTFKKEYGLWYPYKAQYRLRYGVR